MQMTQLFTAIDTANQPALSLTALRDSIEDVMRWNTQNMLRGNAEKTEFNYAIYITVHRDT